MRLRHLPALLGLASLPLLMTAVAASDEVAPAHALVKPFPRAKTIQQSTRNFDDYWIPLGRLTGEAQAEKVALLGGRWTHREFTSPAGHAVAEIFRHYELQLSRAGFEVVYACRGQECGEGGRKSNGDWWPLSDHRRYLAARLARPAGDLWVSVHVHARAATAPVQHELDIIEVKPPAIQPPPRDEADVATLEKELKADGRVVLHSLGFADQRPQLLPGSERVIRAIAGLLERDPALRLYVVVHGEDMGPPNPSLELTKKRAAALVTALTRQHKIAPARLHAAGAGPFAPIAPHRSAEGREKNRRVELVAMGAGAVGPAAARVRR